MSHHVNFIAKGHDILPDVMCHTFGSLYSIVYHDWYRCLWTDPGDCTIHIFVSAGVTDKEYLELFGLWSSLLVDQKTELILHSANLLLLFLSSRNRLPLYQV